MTKKEALTLIRKHIKNENLIKHMFAVEATMRAYAKKFGEDEGKWALAGLLHDIDYEEYKDKHPSEEGAQILRDAGVEEDIVHAIRAHGYHGVERKSLMDKALFAVDPLTGFIVACSLVRPNKISDLEVKSVKKKMKDKAFAAQVNRDEIKEGAEKLGVGLDEHIEVVLGAMKEIKGKLGL